MSKGKKLGDLSLAEAFKVIDRRREARMARIDALPSDIRELVNEYSFAVVDALMSVGVTKAKHIRHVVETVLDNFSPTRATHTYQGRPELSDRSRA